ncbi:hypothetical protein BT96DRAFT_984188 [Gymnopus androsaceus JB14]|uniref:Uncharacterized protein n=1 Tax=Gymnopus androsaceus JB14 TaxID=1447944 RepID=A0A6A4IGQ4_9AGAR|nr:hypothetical protein BT96DRAFT_984188 [Gymnopus androsaceus JB14]
MSNLNIEVRLYPLIDGVMQELCLLAQSLKEGRILQCHSQALFSGTEGSQTPDCAACIFDLTSETWNPAFWFEGKALEDDDDWRTSDEAAAASRADTITLLGTSGCYWSLTKKKRQKLNATLTTKGEEPPKKKRRKEAVPDPGIYNTFNITISADLLPELVYSNEPLVFGKPSKEYNPAFLDTVSVVMIHNEFDLQLLGLEKLQDGYLLDVIDDIEQHNMSAEDEIWSPSPDPTDTAYRASTSTTAARTEPYPQRERRARYAGKGEDEEESS